MNEDKSANNSNRNSTLVYPNDSTSSDSDNNGEIFPTIAVINTELEDRNTNTALISNPFNPNNPFYDQINLLQISSAINTSENESTPSNNYLFDANLMSTSCEEAAEVNNVNVMENMNQRVGGILPPPHEFGGGNPFLMFLCLTLLLQHRDYVMKSGMDYNEMAMHFDKMVRKHNVIRVLNQARRMYAEYLKLYRETLKMNGGSVIVNISNNNNNNNNNGNVSNNSKRGSNGEVFNV
jgi:hypothetical protein